MKPIQMLYCLIQNTTAASHYPALRELLKDAQKNNIIQTCDQSRLRRIVHQKQRNIQNGKERKKHQELAEKREQAATCIYKNIQSSDQPEHLKGIKRLMQNALKLGVITPPDYLLMHTAYLKKEQEINREIPNFSTCQALA